MNIETRSFELAEFRAVDEVNPRRLVGTAIVYRSLANIGKFWERINPGALGKVLVSEPNITALYEHDRRGLLASTRNGTLRLTDGPDGLNFEMDVAETSVGNDVLKLVQVGELRGLSFSFAAAQNGQRWHRDAGKIIRDIDQLERLPESQLRWHRLMTRHHWRSGPLTKSG